MSKTTIKMVIILMKILFKIKIYTIIISIIVIKILFKIKIYTVIISIIVMKIILIIIMIMILIINLKCSKILIHNLKNNYHIKIIKIPNKYHDIYINIK